MPAQDGKVGTVNERGAGQVLALEHVMLSEQDLYTYKCAVTNIVDGDTVDVMVDLGMDMYHQARIRLSGIDTYEVRGEEREQGLLAKEFLGFLLEENPDPLFLRTVKDRKGKYGRYLGELYLADGRCVNKLLEEEGHCKEG